MNLDYIAEFLAIAQEGSISAAAKKMYTTQPNISKHLVQLEDKIGVKLVDRTTRTLSLTPAGVEAFQLWEPLYQDFAASVTSIKESYRQQTNIVRIGALSNLASDYIAPVIDANLEGTEDSLQGITLEIVIESPGNLIRLLKSGEIDVALIFDLPFGLEGTYFRKPFTQIPLMVALPPKEHDARESVSVLSLRSRPLVLNVSFDEYPIMVQECLKNAGVIPPAIIMADNVETIPYTLRQTEGYTIISADTQRSFRGLVDFYAIEEPGFEMHVCWLYHSSAPNREAIERVLTALSK